MPIDYTPKKPKVEYTGFSHKYSSRSKKAVITLPVSSGYNPRETKKYPSRVTPGGDTPYKQSVQYTGNEMVGISIIHKSCLQPVFSKESATDAASMRR